MACWAGRQSSIDLNIVACPCERPADGVAGGLGDGADQTLCTACSALFPVFNQAFHATKCLFGALLAGVIDFLTFT